MRKMIIEFEHEDVMTPRPWPVGVNEQFDVTSGLGKDDGARLIGFGMLGEQHVDVFPEAALEHPELVSGLAATFCTPTEMFEWSLRIREMRVIEVTS